VFYRTSQALNHITPLFDELIEQIVITVSCGSNQCSVVGGELVEQ
jgi:hypothetical protein